MKLTSQAAFFENTASGGLQKSSINYYGTPQQVKKDILFIDID